MTFMETVTQWKNKLFPHSKQRITDMHQDYFLLDDASPYYVREAYNSLRTNMVFLMSTAERKQVVFTSSIPGEGKTTTALNVAILFAQTGAKVLLVDADMRRPKVHRAMKRKHAPGLSDLLGKLNTLADCIQTTHIPNLDMIAAGTTPPNPSELLFSPQFDQLMTELDQTYDYVFVDAPPIKSVTDAAIISTKLAGAIMVVRSGIAHKPEIAEALGAFDIAGGKVLGFILNDISRENLIGYGSKYRNHYYSSYASKKE